jgi:small subunit ribosomal protein S12e
MYIKLVEALCAEHNIPLIRVPDNKKLGEWVGLCKFDKENKPRKVVKCSCVAVKVCVCARRRRTRTQDYGPDSPSVQQLKAQFNKNA